MDVAFADWLTQCPDKLKFALEYVDLRADIANVIETYEYEFASIEVEKEVTEAVLNKLINQDWSEQNEYISDLIDQEIV
tara:strand:- start:110 stop:346 length:237 start_codon:yes stop_codon:yes gene_type:complete